MENLEQQEKVINLAKLIIKELENDEETDLLSKWMVFYISEQITLIEKAELEEKESLKYKCFDLILKLWNHRYCFPNNKYPFQRFEEIFNTLEQLSPENENPYFYRKYSGENATESRVKNLMEIAKGIDDAAKIWLTYVFQEASKESLDDKMIEWINSSIEMQDQKDVSIIIKMLETDLLETEEIDDEINENKEKLIRSRIEKLEDFNRFNSDLITILSSQLKD